MGLCRTLALGWREQWTDYPLPQLCVPFAGKWLGTAAPLVLAGEAGRLLGLSKMAGDRLVSCEIWQHTTVVRTELGQTAS